MTVQYLELATKVGDGSAKLEDFDELRNAAAQSNVATQVKIGHLVGKFKDKTLTVDDVLAVGSYLPEKKVEKVAEQPPKEPTKAEVKAAAEKPVASAASTSASYVG